ncbi:UNVERIFIED_CONTAM: protein FLOWERING LOCUS D [Sesamum angustifolium]|uniref:Protein FLOWERING LOCUS D n=1 Tax=Sesamum angustifolium TaxID=2727405 RepID=A0AAW2LG26_9LAMI
MDSSNQDSHTHISDQLNNPFQLTIHVPDSSSPSGNGLQNPNLNPNFGENPISDAKTVHDHFRSVQVPKGKRCGRPRNPVSSLNQVRKISPMSFNNGLSNVGVSSVASTSGQVSKTQMENSSNLIPKKHGSGSNSGNVPKKIVDDMSDEIIVINKEATAEALIALTAGFPADSLTEEEIDYGVVSVVGGIEQVNYILIRNHIITRWRENVSNWVTKEMFLDIVPKHCWGLLDTAYSYLVSHGYINFGVAPAIKERILVEPKHSSVIVIGAGLAGLAAARQLMAFGFKVTVVEGRKRAGGRVYTKKLDYKNRFAAVDLGGSVLTGTLGNPLGILARQLSFTLHKVRDKCPLYRVDGKPVDPDLDRRVETSFNQLLDILSKIRLSMGEVSQDVSLGAALETFREAFNEEEMNLFNWHLANLEYANASLLSKLSLAFWDQDDPYDMGGDHCFLPGGNGRLVQALVENVPIHYEKTVQSIRYGSDRVQVSVEGGQIYEGDMVLCTVPLGVLKNGSIKFIPELPQRKLDAINRLGFGLLNKVALLFPHAFWGTDLDTFGHLSDHPSYRGEFFLFYSYATVAGGPLLIALVAGEAAYRFEIMDPTEAVRRVLRILRGVPKSKAASANQKLIRKAKIIRNCNRSSIPSTNIESKVGSNGVNLECRALVSSNSSSRPGSDIGVRVSSSNGDMPPSNSHNSAVFVSHVGCSIPQNLGHNNGSTSSFGSNVGSTASGSNKAPVDSNVGMTTLGDMPSSYPQNFLASSLTPASSNSLGEALSTTNTQSLPHLDVHMDLLGDTSGSNTQNFVSRNDSATPPSSEMGMVAVSSNSSLAPSNSNISSFNIQTPIGDISDSISCISNQENIFEDIMNELLPESGSSSGAWQLTGKL